MSIRWIGPLLAAVSWAVLATACSGNGHAGGTVTGHLYGVGGAPPGLHRPWPGSVTLTGAGIRLDVPVGTSGVYSITVPAGRYTLVGHSPLYESGTGLCQAAGEVTVASGHGSNADVFCQMA